MFPNIRDQVVAVDTETTGLQWWVDRVFGVSLSVNDDDYYWDVRDEPRVLDWLRNELHLVRRLYAHNLKFDAHMLRNADIEVPYQKSLCTVVGAALIDEHMLAYDLDYVGKKFVNVGKDATLLDQLRKLFGEKLTENQLMKRLSQAPVEVVAKYAKQDTRTTLLLGKWEDEEIVRQELQDVVQLECELLPVLVDIERHGVNVDVAASEQAVVDINRLVTERQGQLNALAGFEVNPNPSGSITKLFDPRQDANKQWVLVDGTIANTTDGGKASINAEVLRRMRHPAAAMILELRKAIKTRDTFIEGHILGHHVNGVIHCNINQTKGDNEAGTGTGRLSINAPALQQIHKRDAAIAKIVRSLFIPRPGQKWLCGDLSQAEMRWFAHYCNSPSMIAKYTNDPDTDFYQLLSDLSGLPRNPRHTGGANTKQISLAAVFGMSDGRLCTEMGYPAIAEMGKNGKLYNKPGIEGQAILDKFNAAVPGIRSFLSSASSVARSRGYVRSVAGRHLRFPGGQFTHKAGGLILQAANADAIKRIMIELHRLLRGTDSQLLFSVHDEGDLSLDAGDVQRGIIPEIKDTMESLGGIRCRVPHKCEPKLGANWYEASCT